MPLVPGSVTVLVIDDEPLVLSLTNAMLSRCGYTVVTAGSGTEAIRLFENGPDIEIDLLLVDLAMPDMTGNEAVKRILELRPGLPVLYFSSYSEVESLRPSYPYSDPYITKPFSSQQLIRKIRKVLERPKSEAANRGSPSSD
jgi:two-component system, cell cycle sensor histidine kinase and response regulator CckA